MRGLRAQSSERLHHQSEGLTIHKQSFFSSADFQRINIMGYITLGSPQEEKPFTFGACIPEENGAIGRRWSCSAVRHYMLVAMVEEPHGQIICWGSCWSAWSSFLQRDAWQWFLMTNPVTYPCLRLAGASQPVSNLCDCIPTTPVTFGDSRLAGAKIKSHFEPRFEINFLIGSVQIPSHSSNTKFVQSAQVFWLILVCLIETFFCLGNVIVSPQIQS